MDTAPPLIRRKESQKRSQFSLIKSTREGGKRVFPDARVFASNGDSASHVPRYTLVSVTTDMGGWSLSEAGLALTFHVSL